MASTGAGTGAVAGRRAAARPALIARLVEHETKAAIKTTEFWTMVLLVVAILVSAAVVSGDGDTFVAHQAWLYVAILGAGYFISRGLAKAGSYEPDPDYNPADLGLAERVAERKDR
jgi:hypothetical protein